MMIMKGSSFLQGWKLYIQLFVYDLNTVDVQIYKFKKADHFQIDHSFCIKSIRHDIYPYKNYKEGSNQRLKRDEANERNHVMKAIAADILYLLQNFGGQYGPSAWSRTSTTLAVEHAAARVRIDSTC